jgi:hypothetical protein
MAGFASRPSFAGHADDSASERHPLTFKLDHPMGAGHDLPPQDTSRSFAFTRRLACS